LSALIDFRGYGPVREDVVGKIHKHIDGLIDQTSYLTMSD